MYRRRSGTLAVLDVLLRAKVLFGDSHKANDSAIEVAPAHCLLQWLLTLPMLWINLNLASPKRFLLSRLRRNVHIIHVLRDHSTNGDRVPHLRDPNGD